MSLDNRPEDTPTIEGVDQLEALFRAAEKPPERFRIGMEHEKIGLLADTLKPLPYYGDRSIETVLRLLQERLGFEAFYEGRDVVALVKDGTNITLEPGGQLELSGAVLKDNHATCQELHDHVEVTRALGDELGVVWLGVGHHPFAARHEIQWVPKDRYAIMRRYLPTRGDRALDMMLRTGTVQANVDWSDEADMAAKLRTALGVMPLVSAVYANSSIVEGRTTGWVSERQRIWRDVDPDRTGLLSFVFRDDFGYRDYAEWALDVPMFFIRRGGQYLGGIAGTPFRHFLEHGWEGYRARVSDWEDHLTTLFPEARIKGFLEVRGADCCDRRLNCAFPALWEGLLYDRQALDEAWTLVADWSLETRQEAILAVARDGLQAQVAGRPVLDQTRALVDIARAALARAHRVDPVGRDETRFMQPLDEVLERGVSPGRVAADLWDGAFAHDPQKLVAHYRF